MAPERKAKKGGKRESVRFNIYLPKEVYDALERLREMSGKRSLAETIRSALKLYMIVQEEIGEGKEFFLEDRDSKYREKLRVKAL